jgi:glycosyltransferase involved in cell wall biosynthesis
MILHSRTMRVGLHNPFLAALGGGEKYFLSILEEAVRLPAVDVELYAPQTPDPAAWERLNVRVPAGGFTAVEADDEEVSARSGALDLLVAFTNDVPPLSHARRSVAMVQFPVVPRERPAARLRAAAATLTGRRRAPAALRSYDLFLVNSEFTRGWTRRRLGVQAVVLAPPVDPPRAAGPAGGRGREILAVGRFFRGEHDKRQDVLISAFRQLHALDWELHLLGGADERPQTSERLAELRDLAGDLPVHFHVNAPGAELAERYARASLFWHAAGYGVDANRAPERLEHFGIATAEAMLRGAVPLVFGGGGQIEVVSDGVTGLHWRTPAELANRTRALIADPERAEALRAAGQEHARRWGRERFGAAIRELVFEPVDR